MVSWLSIYRTGLHDVLDCENLGNDMKLTMQKKATPHSRLTLPIAGFLGFIVLGALIVLPALMEDWYGLANSLFCATNLGIINFLFRTSPT